jgi:hypothetical protein
VEPVDDSGADNPGVDARPSSMAIFPECLSFRQAAGPARGEADVVLVPGPAETEEVLNELELLVCFAAQDRRATQVQVHIHRVREGVKVQCEVR